jgi:hypothetical protein
VLEELARADLIIVEHDSGERQAIKGLWACIQAGEDPTSDGHVNMAIVRVANTTQAELLCDALEKLADGRLDDKILATLRTNAVGRGCDSRWPA